MNRTSSKLILGALALLTLPLVASAAPLSERDIDNRLRQCANNYGVDLHGMNKCYFHLAVEANDVHICDNIRWSALSAGCKREVSFRDLPSYMGYIPQSPFVFFLIITIFIVIKKPPRKPYLYGAIGGTVWGLVLYYGLQSPDLVKYQSYFLGATLPVDGLIAYSPNFMTDLPFMAHFLVVHAVLYGVVIGLLLQGEDKARTHALLLLVFAFVLAFWEHPALAFLRDGISTIKETLMS